MKMGENSLKLAGNFDYFLSGGVGAAAGGEFAFKDILFLRAGAHIGTGTSPLPTYLSLGSGVKFAGFHADFCWLTANEVIGNTLMVGIGYCF